MARLRRKFNPAQPRDLRGRWRKATASKGTKPATQSRGLSRLVGNPTGASTPGVAVGKAFVHSGPDKDSPYYVDRKGDFTADDRKGKTKSKRKTGKRSVGKANAVPYVRISPKTIGAGIDAGAPIGKNLRLSVGGYVRVTRVNSSETENAIGKALANQNPIAQAGLQRILSNQVKLPKNASARMGTSQGGLPSVKIRKEFSRVSNKNHAKAVEDYQNAMARRLNGKKVKGSRPQRRKKNPQQ